MVDISGIAQIAPMIDPPVTVVASDGGQDLRALAEKFESAFVAEMLKHSGLGQMPDAFNGGAGEARFSGFLIQEYADQISRTGRLGLADQIYKSLLERVQP